MDEIQKVLIKAGKRDLAQKYFLKIKSQKKDFLDIQELSSGFTRDPSVLENVRAVISGEMPVKLKNKQLYLVEKKLRQDQLQKGQIVAAFYNSINQGFDIYEVDKNAKKEAEKIFKEMQSGSSSNYVSDYFKHVEKNKLSSNVLAVSKSTLENVKESHAERALIKLLEKIFPTLAYKSPGISIKFLDDPLKPIKNMTVGFGNSLDEDDKQKVLSGIKKIIPSSKIKGIETKESKDYTTIKVEYTQLLS